MRSVVSVLRSGGSYGPEHVYRLQQQVERYMPDVAFVCLSDVELKCTTVPLIFKWPGWWSKIELFRPGLFDGQVVYIDLDTTVRGSFDPVFKTSFTMLRDFYKRHDYGSGLMAWNGSAPKGVFDQFCKDPQAHMKKYRTPSRWGDQGFIRDYADDIKCFGDNDGIVSYKVHCKDGVPDAANIVCFHGTPKPWDVEI